MNYYVWKTYFFILNFLFLCTFYKTRFSGKNDGCIWTKFLDKNILLNKILKL
jgi:hypothetical protein